MRIFKVLGFGAPYIRDFMVFIFIHQNCFAFDIFKWRVDALLLGYQCCGTCDWCLVHTALSRGSSHCRKIFHKYINGSIQDCGISSAWLAMEIQQSCAVPSVYEYHKSLLFVCIFCLWITNDHLDALWYNCKVSSHLKMLTHWHRGVVATILSV